MTMADLEAMSAIGTLNYLGSVAILLAILYVLIALALVVIIHVSLWKVFVKAGYKGWEGLIPVYNTWLLVKMTGLEWWFFLLAQGLTITNILNELTNFGKLATLAGMFAIHYNLALKFKKEPVGYAFGLTLLPFIFYPMLAFSNAEFTDVKVSRLGPVEDKKSK